MWNIKKQQKIKVDATCAYIDVGRMAVLHM